MARIDIFYLLDLQRYHLAYRSVRSATNSILCEVRSPMKSLIAAVEYPSCFCSKTLVRFHSSNGVLALPLVEAAACFTPLDDGMMSWTGLSACSNSLMGSWIGRA